MTIQEAILQRRSIYPNEFTGETIDNDTINSLLQLANRAPSHKNTEPWRFKVLHGEAKSKLADFFQKIYQQNTSPEEFDTFKYKKLRKKVDLSSHVLVLSMQRDPQQRIPEWEEIAAMACALQNLWLAATDLGIGGYWSSPKFYLEPINEFISFKEGEKCFGFFYLGIPSQLDGEPSPKGDWKDKVEWIS